MKNKLKNLLKGNENGFTILEALIALVIISVLFVLILNVFTLGIGKTNYLGNEKKIIGFEQELISWIQKDYRENSIVDIEVKGETLEGELTDSHLIFTLSSGNIIEYKNKKNGFHRITPLETKQLYASKVTNIKYDLDSSVLKVTYRLGNDEKAVSINLDK